MIGQTISHYKIIEKLGEGGMGVVYRAEDTKLDRFVALKFLPRHLSQSAEDKQRFIHEAKAASALDHHNICTVHEIDETEDGQMFIAMAAYDGESLKEKIGRGPLAIEETIDIAIQISQGLVKAHSKQIIHRDIKPANILITEDGIVKIVDFGLAKLAGRTMLTKEGMTLGTTSYMSPEQTQGAKVDHRTDIWAFGAVLYEMVTGQQPFAGDYEQAVMYSIVNEALEPITGLRTGVPMELERIVNKCLEKEPSKRYQHADELIVDLRRAQKLVAKETGVAVSDTTSAVTSVKTFGGKSWLGASAAAVFLFTMVWIVSQLILEDQPSPVVAREKSIAVMYFENRSGEPDLDKILVDMLTTNLARYDELEVVSSQRLFDILKNMEKLDAQTIDRSVATEVANLAGVKTMLLGSIIHLGNKIRITSQLIDVQTGSVIGSPRADGVKVEDVFGMVDDLTAEVSQNMEVATTKSEAERFKIAEVTTTSYEAYKYYQKGLEANWRYDFKNALGNLERAVAIDSTFAMAQTYRAYQRGWRGLTYPSWDLSPYRKSLELAEKYSRKASHKERLFILAIQAAMNRDFQKAESLLVDYVNRYPMEKNVAIELCNMARINGNVDRQIWTIERVLESHPAFANAYSILANIYAAQNKHAKAISASKKYRALEPDISHPYYFAGEIYMQAGQFDMALRISEQALQKNPEWYKLYRHLWHINLYRGAGEKAWDYLRRLRWDSISKFRPIRWTYVYERRYEKAAEQFRNAADQSLRVQKIPYDAVSALLELGKLRTVQGKYKKALAVFKEAVQISDGIDEVNNVRIWTEYLAGSALVKKGALREAQARARKIQEMVEKENYDRFYLDYYHLLLAEIHLVQGDGQAALAALDNYNIAALYSPRFRTLKAASHALLGHYDEAIKQYKDFYNFVPARYNAMGGDRIDYYYERSRVPYNLAKIYEQMEDVPKAIEYYSKALDQWKNADPDVPELVDTKARLVHLNEVSTE